MHQNCQQYQQIYKEFLDLKQRFEAKMEQIREDGIIDKETEELKQQLQEKQREMIPLLEKHFGKWEFSEEIEEKSLEYMEKLLKEGANKGWVAQGLAGLDSEKAWNMREKLLEEGTGESFVAQGLAGLDSEKAWNMREKLLEEGANKGWVAEGLAGLDSEKAWNMREKLLEEGASKNSIALGLAGDYITFVWRYQEKK